MTYIRNLFAFLILVSAFICPQSNSLAGDVGIEIQSEPIAAFDLGDSSRTVFGALEFRGGLVLKSSAKTFGGISALRVQKDGAHFIALSDRSTWLRGRIEYKDNRPIGIVDAAMAPILNADGKPEPPFDSESIAQDGDTLYVGTERNNRILRFNYGKEGFLARCEPIPVPPGIVSLPFNQGLEALVYVPGELPLAGALLSLSENGQDEAGNLKAFIVGGPNPGDFAVKRTDSYSISDAALLPSGDLLILERKYSMDRGTSMRIRRIPLADIKPGAIVDGPIIIEADTRYQIDNMEALSVHRTSSGETLLTLMSDNNFSPTQRTVLLQFLLREK